MPGSSNGPSVFQDLPTVLSAICLTCLHVSTIPSCNPSTEKVKGLQFVCCSLLVHLILLKFYPVDRQEHQGWTKSQSRKGISLHVRVQDQEQTLDAREPSIHQAALHLRHGPRKTSEKHSSVHRCIYKRRLRLNYAKKNR